MRIVLVVLAALLMAADASGMDLLLGRVVRTDPETGRMVVRVADGGDGSGEVTVTLPPDGSGAGVSAGDYVRVWGDFINSASGTFSARHLTGGPPPRPGRDPTGVRERILRGHRMGGPGPPGGRPGGGMPGGPGGHRGRR